MPRYLKLFYERFTKHSPKDIGENFKVIYPTEDYVKESLLGVEMASSLCLNEKQWDETPDFPKNSFYTLEGSSK